MPPRDETRLEHTLGRLLRAGVILSALVVLAGGKVFLDRHGGEPVERGEFRGEPESLHTVGGSRPALWPGGAAASSSSGCCC